MTGRPGTVQDTGMGGGHQPRLRMSAPPRVVIGATAVPRRPVHGPGATGPARVTEPYPNVTLRDHCRVELPGRVTSETGVTRLLLIAGHAAVAGEPAR